jgi:hypothetical protein
MCAEMHVSQVILGAFLHTCLPEVGKSLEATMSRVPLAVALDVAPLQFLELAVDIDHDCVTQSGNVCNLFLIPEEGSLENQPCA